MVVGEEEANTFGEGGEIGWSGVITGLCCGCAEGAGLEGVGEVGERAAGCATFESGEVLV
jgi:hypothetical protein